MSERHEGSGRLIMNGNTTLRRDDTKFMGVSLFGRLVLKLIKSCSKEGSSNGHRGKVYDRVVGRPHYNKYSLDDTMIVKRP